MVEAPATLLNLHQLLRQALALSDELNETYVGAVIDTAVQAVHEKVQSDRA
jgi:hypothetical protein